MTLNFYIARRFLVAIVLVYTVVLFLGILFTTLDLSRRVGTQTDVTLAWLLALSAHRAPSFTIKAAPFIMLIAAMWTCARLARSSELVVAKAAGRSPWGIAAPCMVTAALVGAFVITFYDPVAAALLDRGKTLEAELLGDETRRLTVEPSGLVLRQGNREQRTMIFALESNGNATELTSVEVLQFDGEHRWLATFVADGAKLETGYWAMADVTIWEADRTDPDGYPIRTERAFWNLPTDLTPEQILDSFAAPETIDFWRLPEVIAALQLQGFSARRHILHFQSTLALPLVFVAMALFGAAFSMRHARFGGLGLMALYGVLTGFGSFFVFDIARALAGSGDLPAIPAAWGPPFAALLLASGLLLHFEEG